MVIIEAWVPAPARSGHKGRQIDTACGYKDYSSCRRPCARQQNYRCAIGLMELVINPWVDGVQGWQ